MRLKHKYLLALALLLLNLISFSDDCVAQRIPAEPILFNNNDSEDGLIFGTITFTDPKAKYDNYFPWIACLSGDSKTSKNNSGQIVISTLQKQHNGELQGGRTYLFVMQKAPGIYSIPSIRMSKVKGNGATSDIFITGFNVPFGVMKGQILYVGEITINEYAKRNETIVTVADHFERDLQAVKSRQPLVDWSLATKSEIKVIHNK